MQYLPDLDVLGDAQGFDRRDANTFLKFVHRIQHGTNARCKEAMAFWHDDLGALGHNFFSDIIAPFSYTISMGRPLILANSDDMKELKAWQFTNNSFCKQRKRNGWLCFLKQVTSCAEQDDLAAHIRWDAGGHEDVFPLFMTPITGYEKHGLVWATSLITKYIWSL